MIPITLVIAAVGLVAFVVSYFVESVLLAIAGALAFFVSVSLYRDGSPEHQAQVKADAEAARLAAIPHVIRDADGCKVYAFTAGGHEHFYTRCAESVTTERFYTVKVPCGKNCTRDEPRSEVIVTSKGPQ